jgi:CBS domain-containing protein
MKTVTGATPLRALDAVAMDTETTGLDTTTARIVQIGAVILSRGHLVRAEPYEALVNPGIAIPPSSTAIHGISDDMVRYRQGFDAAFRQWEDYRQGRVVVGYALGFDFAVIARECERAGIAWKQPRSLCVRMLAQLANPTLPDHSLETLSSWLSVAITDRHSALGDARAAAAIFVALLPKLADKGIRTLAEAERASLALTRQMESHRTAGWSAPVLQPGQSRAFAQVDPYAYRHRVGSIMSRDLDILEDHQPISAAIAKMVARRISSVLVGFGGKPGGPVDAYGIVTERDVMRLVALKGGDAFALPLGDIATRPLVTVAEEAFVYRAMGRMERFRIRHLAVRDTEDRLSGIVSARDLLKLRGGAAIRLDDAIEASETAGDMAHAWAMLPEVAAVLVEEEEIDARLIAGIVSEELRVMSRRAAILAERAMVAEGLGEAPSPYALLVLGSGGRGESLLAADQDNAIVYETGEKNGPEDRWFAELGRRIADTLDQAGVPYCKGGVMAREPQWRGSLARWRRRADNWVARSDPADLLNVDIFFDFRPVHGSQRLAATLFDHAFAAGHGHMPFAKLLGDRLGEIGTPFTIFGNIRSENGRVDLKRAGLFPIVAFARALAIRHDVRHRSTRHRLEGLIARDIGADEDLRALLDGHAFLLSLMLAQQSEDLAAGIPVSNRVEIAGLGASQTARLKTVLRLVERIPGLFRSLVTARPR